MSEMSHDQGDKRAMGDKRILKQGHVEREEARIGVRGNAGDLPLKPLAVRYEVAGWMIDRSARTIRRMVDRGELVGLKGLALVEVASIEAWVEEKCYG